MNRKRWFALLILALFGCGAPEPETYVVTGSVTLAGQPVERGGIAFHPLAGTASPPGGTFQEGRFEFKAPPGKYRVAIHAPQEIPGKKGKMGEPRTVEAIPEQFNTKSTHIVEVTPGGDNHFTFTIPGARR